MVKLGELESDDIRDLQIAPYFHVKSLQKAIKLSIEKKLRPLSHTSDTRRIKGRKSIEIDTVHLWTAHHVIDWLRVIDFGEYTPKLQGAGVHGALIVYADEFNSNVLADILGIPSTATTIREELFGNFNRLLKREVKLSK